MRGAVRMMVLIVAAGAVAGACSSESGSDATTASSAATEVSRPPTPSSSPSSAVSVVVTPQVDSTTPSLASLIAACQEYVPLAAFTGDVAMQAVWNDVGQDPARLATRCAELVTEAPDQLLSMAEDLRALQAQLSGSTPATSDAVPPGSDPPPEPGSDTSAATTEPTATPSAPGSSRMPNVLCMGIDEAMAAIGAVSDRSVTAFVVGGDGEAVDGSAWIVVTQSPGAGAAVVRDPLLGVVEVGDPRAC